MANKTEKTKALKTGGKPTKPKAAAPKSSAKGSPAAKTTAKRAAKPAAKAPAKSAAKPAAKRAAKPAAKSAPKAPAKSKKPAGARERSLALGSTPGMAGGKSTSEVVDACIFRLVPGAEYEGDTPLSSIPVTGRALGQCLNRNLNLLPEWAPGEIDDGWTVDVVSEKTDERRQ